jgi:MarR family transcriptional regulator, organic hydroperoxide resistance regulator
VARRTAQTSSKIPDDIPGGDGLLLRDSFRLFRKALQTLLAAETGVTVAQYWVLRTLWIEDGITHIELGQKLGIEKAGITSIIQNMEKQGLILRRRNDTDRRKFNLFLTERGKTLREPVLACARRVNARAAGSIPASELKQMRSVIRRMMRNVVEAYDLPIDED